MIERGYIIETVKLLAENVKEKLCDIGLGNTFLDMTPRTQEEKQINK